MSDFRRITRAPTRARTRARYARGPALLGYSSEILVADFKAIFIFGQPLKKSRRVFFYFFRLLSE
jgi:hypothetical protein